MFTLESIWLGIEQATGDVEILRAYDNASTTLRQVLKAPEFERLDQTMDNLTEAMSEQQDLEHALRTASDATALPNVDEEELLQELEQLTLTPASSQKKSTNNAEPQQELPSAPMIEPQKAQAPKTETVQQNRQGQAIQAT